MRITPVTNAYRRNFTPQKQVSFGRFADDNARDVVKKAFGNDEWTKPRDDYYYKLMDEADYLTIYTDKDGVVKGRFDDELMNSEKGAEIADCLDITNDSDLLKNLSKNKNVHWLGVNLDFIKDVINDVDFLAQLRSDDDGAAAQAEQEARRQARIDHLNW